MELIHDVGPPQKIGVCLIDSCYDPGDEFKKYNEVGRTVDIFEEQVEGSDHWAQVLTVLNFSTNDPVYHFIRTIGTESGVFTDTDLMLAFGKVLEFKDEIDVVNLSAGLDHIADDTKDCSGSGPRCAVCDVAREIVEAGIILVAGAGNFPRTEAVCCPSLDPAVIAVGGMVAKCTASVTASDPMLVDSSLRPPNALWVEREGMDEFSESFCSNRGCMPGESCSQNRRIEPWEHNVDPVNGKPDILAPVIVPSEDAVGPLISGGTSYSVPIVAGQIVNTLTMFHDTATEPTPSVIRRSLIDSGDEIPNYPVPVINGEQFCARVSSVYDLQFDRTENDLGFDVGPG